MIVYNQYTAKDVREWLENGAKNGLTENIISLTRANALMHCPCVKDDDVLVVSATDGEKVVGYTAIFPEKLERPDMWIATGTTLWAHPDYADDFVGYNLEQHLWQAHSGCNVIGTDVMPAAALIDKLLGAIAARYERKVYEFDRKIRVQSLRNVGSLLLEPFRKSRQKKAINTILSSIPDDVHVIARDMIDEETYAFIKAHSSNDTFLRSREMLNWILRYPFSAENILKERTKIKMEFSDQMAAHRNYLLQIYKADSLIGVVCLALRAKNMHVKFLYTEEIFSELVYALIIEALCRSQAEQLYSLYPALNAYIETHNLALLIRNKDVLYTYPKAMKSLAPFVLQGADGDMFA